MWEMSLKNKLAMYSRIAAVGTHVIKFSIDKQLIKAHEKIHASMINCLPNNICCKILRSTKFDVNSTNTLSKYLH